MSPWILVQKLTRGEESLKSVTLIEGWTMRQWRQALNKAEGLKHDSVKMSDEDIMKRLGREGERGEGYFYPDTYTFGKNTSDLKVLARSFKSMQRHLDAAWLARDPNQLLTSKEDALILASIVEKETGQAKDRPMIASVFQNRLKIWQLDPPRPENRPPVEHLHERGVAPDADCHAWRGLLERGPAPGRITCFVFCCQG